MHMTQTVRSPHGLVRRYCIEAKVPNHYPNQSTVCGRYLPFIPRRNGNRSPTSLLLPLLSSTLIYKVSGSVGLTSLTEESTSFTATKRLQEAYLIRGLAALPASFHGRSLG